MKFAIHNWYKIGAIFGIILLISILCGAFNNNIQRLLVFNLICLLAHQFEEYQLPGGAPVIINRVVYCEKTRANYYPGNGLSIMIVNVSAWLIYFIAIMAYQVIWFGLGVVLFSLFQILSHCFGNAIKLRAWYNPGMATTFLLFLPLGIVFIHELAGEQLLDAKTWLLAIVTLIGCILISIVIPVQSLKNEETKYPIDAKQIQRYESIIRHCQIRRHR